ncbi:MAG: hypothetical protein ACLFVQ_14930 [Chitinispirillaceae bacterium]
MKEIKGSIAFSIILILITSNGYSQTLDAEIEKHTTYLTLGLIGFCAGAVVTGIGLDNYNSKPTIEYFEMEVLPGQKVTTSIEDRSRIELGHKQMLFGIPAAIFFGYITIENSVRVHKLKQRLTLRYSGDGSK